jgi:lipoprotein-releasing system permease protein
VGGLVHISGGSVAASGTGGAISIASYGYTGGSTVQGGLLALGGAAAGSLVGAGALVLWQRYVRNADGTAMFPLVLDPTLFVLALMIATLTGLLAAVAPALRAARLDPVVAIRG